MMETRVEKKGSQGRNPLVLEAVIEDKSIELTDTDLEVQKRMINYLLELHRQKKSSKPIR